jgi:hypothetical protein
VYETPNWTAPNWITLNQTVWSQTKACITKSSSEMCALLGYYATENGNPLLTFWDRLSAPSSKIKKNKSENRTRLKLIDTIFFWDFIHHLIL